MDPPSYNIPEIRKKIFGKFLYLLNMKNMDKILKRVYNTLGNKYLTDNFKTEPFEFDVKVRRGDREDDLQSWIVEVYSVPDLPESFVYKKQNEGRVSDGIHISVLRREFKNYIKYVDPSFGGYGKTIGVKFMNLK